MRRGADSLKHKVKKNTVRRRTDKQYAARARGLIAGLLVLLFCVGVFRVGFIMIAKGNSYRAEAESQQLYDEVIPAVRGTIYDSNMTPLVTGSSAWILVVDPGAVKKLFDDRKCSKVVDGRISAVSSEEKEKNIFST